MLDDELGEGGQVGTEAFVQRFELRNHEYQQHDRNDHRDHQDCGRIEQRLLDLLFEGFRLFLVGRNLVQQGFQRARLLARLDQIHEEIVEVEGVLGKGLMQRRAALDIGLDVQDQLLHCRLVVAVGDDLERLHQRNARRQHGGELPAEDCDIAGVGLAALAALALFANSRRRHALAAKFRAQRLLVRRETLALDARAALIASLPGKRDIALDCFD